jgi:hypothetical protein
VELKADAKLVTVENVRVIKYLHGKAGGAGAASG